MIKRQIKMSKRFCQKNFIFASCIDLSKIGNMLLEVMLMSFLTKVHTSSPQCNTLGLLISTDP